MDRYIQGKTITRVETDSPAAREGLRAGDRLLSVNGEPVKDLIDYEALSVRSRLIVEVEREGESAGQGRGARYVGSHPCTPAVVRGWHLTLLVHLGPQVAPRAQPGRRTGTPTSDGRGCDQGQCTPSFVPTSTAQSQLLL